MSLSPLLNSCHPWIEACKKLIDERNSSQCRLIKWIQHEYITSSLYGSVLGIYMTPCFQYLLLFLLFLLLRSHDLVKSFMLCVLATFIVTLIGHTCILHAWMNMWAEIMKFADREFFSVSVIHRHVGWWLLIPFCSSLIASTATYYDMHVLYMLLYLACTWLTLFAVLFSPGLVDMHIIFFIFPEVESLSSWLDTLIHVSWHEEGRIREWKVDLLTRSAVQRELHSRACS